MDFENSFISRLDSETGFQNGTFGIYHGPAGNTCKESVALSMSSTVLILRSGTLRLTASVIDNNVLHAKHVPLSLCNIADFGHGQLG